MGFSINEVRALAHRYGWMEVQCNTTSRVLGFRRGIQRLNVYYTTGTVGTCTDHPRLGKTQLFRRDVSWSELESVFIDVRSHTGKGYYQKASSDIPDPILRSSNLNWWCTTTNGMNDLVEGNSYDAEDYPIMVLGESWLGIDNEGRPAWGPGIPKLLDNKLRGRQNSLPTVDVVCLGSDEYTYFVQFADGKSEWAGNGIPDDLSRELQRSNSNVKSIALGPDQAYYCMWEDGTEWWENLPQGLYNLLNGRQKSLPPVRNVNLGTRGEYFVVFDDGAWRCNGLPLNADRTVEKIQGEGGEIYDIQFGHGGKWLIRYAE